MVDPDPGYRPRRAADPAADGPAPDSPPAPGAPSGETAPGPAGATPLDAATGGEQNRAGRPLSFRQRRPQPADEDATTVLPRVGAGGRRPARDEDDLDDETRSGGLLGRRGRLALLVSAVAAVVVVGLAIMYAVASVGQPSARPGAGAPSGAGAGSGAPTPTDPAAALLGDNSLLTSAAAQPIAPGTWTVALTHRGAPTEDTPVPACLSTDPVEGDPAPEQEVVRLLSGKGKNAPIALHRATAYASPEDAAQAYAVAARTFGGCATPGAYLVSGAAVTGLGDQAAGLVVNATADGNGGGGDSGDKANLHSIVLSRTGRVLNVVDAARPGRAPSLTGVAKALGAVVRGQCEAAGGRCAATPVLEAAPPPLGGDVPGFLAAGDLPPAGQADESWVATPVEQPDEGFLGSQCETVTWTRTGAEDTASRVYLVPSSTTFGLNEIVLTMKSDKAAAGFVSKIRADLRSCSKRQLTAEVSKPRKVSGVGASAAPVTGWTATVAQKTTEGTQRYRVGIVSSGTKVAYTFLNPLGGGYDLTAEEWDLVAVRAGQRMTQIP